MDVLVMSDIHGNIAALRAVLDAAGSKYKIGACILLGDVIDYGMHPNEVVNALEHIEYPVLCNIWGNHEYAVINKDDTPFSSDRGRVCARYTERILKTQAWKYIRDRMHGRGYAEFEYEGKQCLAVHGSMEDEYWKSIQPHVEAESRYRPYDYVFSGHSHIPHFFEKYYKVDDERYRNKKKVIFINPGSVGQPRNLNSMAQFAVVQMCSEKIVFEKVIYDIRYEQRAIKGRVDEFYSERLERGI